MSNEFLVTQKAYCRSLPSAEGLLYFQGDLLVEWLSGRLATSHELLILLRDE